MVQSPSYLDEIMRMHRKLLCLDSAIAEVLIYFRSVIFTAVVVVILPFAIVHTRQCEHTPAKCVAFTRIIRAYR